MLFMDANHVFYIYCVVSGKIIFPAKPGLNVEYLK